MDKFDVMDLDCLVDESEVKSETMCGIIYYSETMDIDNESDESTSRDTSESLSEINIKNRIIIRKDDAGGANVNDLIVRRTEKDFQLQRNSIQANVNEANIREVDKEMMLKESLKGESAKVPEDSLSEKNVTTGLEIAAKEPHLPKIKFTTLLKLKEKGLKEIIKFCMDLGMITSKFKCPKCKLMMSLKRSDSDVYAWTCRRLTLKEHNNKRVIRSVRTGSFFSISKLSLIDILLIIHCWVYKLPVQWILNEFSFSNKTIFDWFDIFRDTCLEICARDYNKIGGKGTIVEIEGERYIRRKNDEHIKKDSFVFIGSENMYGEKSFLRIVEKCDRNSFLEVIKTCVLPGSTVISEFCSVFKCSTDPDFVNLVKTDKYKFKDPKSKDLSTRKKFWDVIRRKLPRHSKNSKYFDNHIAEFLWRKRISHAYDKMRLFLDDIKAIYPPPTFDG